MTTAIVFSRQTNAGPRASLNFLVIYFFFGLNIRIKVVNPSTTATLALSWNFFSSQWQKKETGKFYQEMLETRRTVEEKTQEA